MLKIKERKQNQSIEIYHMIVLWYFDMVYKVSFQSVLWSHHGAVLVSDGYRAMVLYVFIYEL